jgi:branched-chain amino acid transport system ATP-binding protein
MLEIDNLEAWYGESYVLQGVSLKVGEGEVVSILGHNGAGKTTTLKSIIGLMRRCKGSIRLKGAELIGLRPDRIARHGIAFCPEERAIFSSLTVLENLLLPPVLNAGGLDLKTLYEIFPNLEERAASQGTKLSGGEQQMLAIARILRSGARFLLLDEPTEGLAPAVVQQIGEVIKSIKSRGFTILLVEQNFTFASEIADRHYIMDEGRIVEMVPSDEVEKRTEEINSYLGL